MSPIMLKNYSWTENDSFLYVNIPLNIKPPSKPDVFSFKNYLKVSFPPFLFEVFLFKEIDEDASKCTIHDLEIIFELKKTEPGKWHQLTRDLQKGEKVAERQKVNENKELKGKEEKAARKERLRGLQSVAVQQQIDLDRRNKESVEKIKNREKETAMMALEEWKRDIPVVRCESKSNERRKDLKIASECSEKFSIPMVRQSGRIHVNFSSREFPTPTRESFQEQEKEFLAKQLEARKATGFLSEDLRPEECNPVWLNNKGNEFYRVKNYLGAISAYSHAIKIGSKLPSLYSNRSAAHLALGNLHKALEDSSTALELLMPPVAANRAARGKAHARRAAILCRLGVPEKSLCEFEEALRLHPTDRLLQEDYENAKIMVEQFHDSD